MNNNLEVFLTLGDAVIITDEEFRILAVNSSYEFITGYSVNEIKGKKASFLRTKHTPLETYVQMKEAIRNGLSWSGVFTNHKKNNDLWHSSITITPYNIDGIIYFVGIFRELEQLDRGYYLNDSRVGRIQESLLKVLAISCEIRDPDTEEHLRRVQQLTQLLIARYNQDYRLGLPNETLRHIANSSILHDIGKSAIPEGILYKPGPLAEYERKIIEMHTIIGLDIVDKIFAELNDELLKSEFFTAKNIILHHHEKWDGTGYPHQLQGENIPLEARIVSVVDVFDALTTKRAYKEKWSIEDAITYLIVQRGKHFDEKVVDSFVSLHKEGLLPKI